MDIKTITVQIGNTDDKLTQAQWSSFVEEVRLAINYHSYELHFSGGPESSKPWQNYCWVFAIKGSRADQPLRDHLSNIAHSYQQDSIAWTAGDTEFI